MPEKLLQAVIFTFLLNLILGIGQTSTARTTTASPLISMVQRLQ